MPKVWSSDTSSEDDQSMTQPDDGCPFEEPQPLAEAEVERVPSGKGRPHFWHEPDFASNLLLSRSSTCSSQSVDSFGSYRLFCMATVLAFFAP